MALQFLVQIMEEVIVVAALVVEVIVGVRALKLNGWKVWRSAQVGEISSE